MASRKEEMVMDLKQNPFSLYDFLGYLIPGALFLYTAEVVVVSFEVTKVADYPNLLQMVKAVVEAMDNRLVMLSWHTYIPLTILAYTVGQILSFLSSISIEKYVVWSCGYPSKYLLRQIPKGYVDIEFTTEDPTLRRTVQKLNRLLVFIFLSPISAIDQSLGRFFGIQREYSKPLDSLLRRSLRRKIHDFLRTNVLTSYQTEKEADPDPYPLPRDSDFFRFIHHYALENAPKHVQPMQNYVALYGFLRTVSFVFVLLFWVLPFVAISRSLPILGALVALLIMFIVAAYLLLAVKYFFKRRYAVWWSIVLIALGGTFSAVENNALLLISCFLAYTTFLGFQKFYRRHTYEALMAMAVTYIERAGEKKERKLR